MREKSWGEDRSSRQQTVSKNKVRGCGSFSSVLMKKSQCLRLLSQQILWPGQSTAKKQPKEVSFISAHGFRGILIHHSREGTVAEPCVGGSSPGTEEQVECPGWNKKWV